MKGKKTIGVTGGVGSGKSAVLRLLKDRYGARIILADLVAHDLMNPGTEGLLRVTEALGDSFLAEDGSVDRKKLGDLIFNDQKAMEIMNGIIHPMVWAAIKQEALEAPEKLVVVEAAIFTTAPADFFDEMWYIYSDREKRIRRLMESRGYSREKCESIMSRQESDGEYRKRCDRVIDNNGSKEETGRQLEDIVNHEIC